MSWWLFSIHYVKVDHCKGLNSHHLHTEWAEEDGGGAGLAIWRVAEVEDKEVVEGEAGEVGTLCVTMKIQKFFSWVFCFVIVPKLCLYRTNPSSPICFSISAKL